MHFEPHRLVALFCLLTLVSGCSDRSPSEGTAAVQPGLDESRFGAPGNILTWTPDQQLAGYQSIDRIYPTREITPGEESFTLPTDLRDLSSLSFEFEGQTFDLDSFVEHNHVAGLLILKNGHVILERYENGNTHQTR